MDKITTDAEIRRGITQQSHQWFFPVYFGHYINHPSAPFHDKIFNITEDQTIKNAVIVAFRNSAKSTIISLSYILWAIFGIQKKKFILILAHTTQQAELYMKNIKDELETNDLLKQDLGPFREDNGWQASSIVIPKYDARIICASYQQGIRGLRHRQFRPDLIICDDVEDLESVKTKEGRDKVFQWLTGEVIPAGDQNTRLIVVGNLLHEDSLIMKLKKLIELGQFEGEYLAIPFADSDGNLAWPGKFDSPEKVESEKKKIGSEIAWQREYMLRIIPDEGQVVHPEWIQYYTDMPKTNFGSHRFAVFAVDLAISMKDSADYTAIVSAEIFGYGEDLKIYILPDPINRRITFPETVQTIKDHAKLFDNQAWIIIEKVQYQEAIIQTLEAQRYHVEPFVPHGADKRMRLSLTTNMIKNGQVLFPTTGTELLLQQLTGFGVESHDDLADAFVMLVLKVAEEDNNSDPFIFPKPIDLEPKIKTDKDADLAQSLEDQYARSQYNETMGATLIAYRGY